MSEVVVFVAGLRGLSPLVSISLTIADLAGEATWPPGRGGVCLSAEEDAAVLAATADFLDKTKAFEVSVSFDGSWLFSSGFDSEVAAVTALFLDTVAVAPSAYKDQEISTPYKAL